MTEAVAPVLTTPTRRQRRIAAVKTFLRRPTNLVSVVILSLAVVCALWPTAWLPHDPNATDILLRLQPPAWREGGDWSYVLGTDNLGRDVLSRLVLGARYSLLIAGLAVLISAVIGVTAGIFAGFHGGRVDSTVMRLVDIQFAFPVIILLIAVVGVVGTGIPQLVIVLGLTGWAQYARIVRGSALSVRNTEYVEAARAVGARPRRIMARDVLPNVASEIIVITSFSLGSLILIESGLSFLGLGIQPPTPSWGGMIGDSRDYLELGWWILAFPGAAIALTVLAFNFLGDGLRDAFDPYTRQVGTRRKHRLDAPVPAALPIDEAPRRVEPPLLSVKHLVTDLTVPAGIVRAVDDVSFDLHPGEVLGLVGESGSGKSMTALSILGLLPSRVGRVTAGEIEFDGRALLSSDSRSLRATRGREIGVVFQDPLTSLNPVTTIGSQLVETIRAHPPRLGKAAARARAVELLDLVGVPNPEARLRQYPHEFSGGMRQRVGIAIAIAHDPRLIIADEPTTALDVTIQAQILDVLRTAQRETSAAVILITHDLGVIAELADRVAVMYAGKIVEISSVDDIFHNPRHPYTVGLLKSLPRIHGDVGRLEPIRGTPPPSLSRPDGCAFRPRCGLAGGREICATTTPTLQTVAQSHLAACHFWREVSSEPTAVAR